MKEVFNHEQHIFYKQQSKRTWGKSRFGTVEIGVPLKKGYNGDLTSAQNGYVGGYMVTKMIEAQEKMMAEKKNS